MVDEGDQGYAYDTTVSGTPKTQALRALRTLRALRALRYRTGKELFYERILLEGIPRAHSLRCRGGCCPKREIRRVPDGKGPYIRTSAKNVAGKYGLWYSFL